MGRFVIVAYKPKPGKESELLQLMKSHVPILRGQGLATEVPAYLMRAQDGTVVEVFEWVSAEAIAMAHTNPVVLEMWAQYDEACTYEALTTLEECHQMFADFEPIEL